jgi:hypothetical protein
MGACECGRTYLRRSARIGADASGPESTGTTHSGSQSAIVTLVGSCSARRTCQADGPMSSSVRASW